MEARVFPWVLSAARDASEVDQIVTAVDVAFDWDQTVERMIPVMVASPRRPDEIRVVAEAVRDAFDNEYVAARVLDRSMQSQRSAEGIARVVRALDATHHDDLREERDLAEFLRS